MNEMVYEVIIDWVDIESRTTCKNSFITLVWALIPIFRYNHLIHALILILYEKIDVTQELRIEEDCQ